MDKLKELRQKKAELMNNKLGLKAQYDEFHAALIKDGLNEDQKTKFKGIKDEAEALNGKITDIEGFIAEYEVLAEQERTATGFVVSEAELNGAQVAKPVFASLGEQLQAIAKSALPENSVDQRLLEVQNAATGGSAGVSSDGGYFIQDDFSTDLIKRVYDEGILANRTRQVEISAKSNKFKTNMIDETSRATGSRMGGVQIYRAAEADTVTAKKPKFAKIDLELEKLMGLAYMTDELMEDATALESVYKEAFTSEFAFTVDDEIFRGTGSGQCLGLLKSDALVTVAKEAGQGADTIVAENIINMYSRLWSRSRPKAAWFINQEIEPQLHQMTIETGTGSGQLVYMPPGGLSQAPYGTMYGLPVIPIEHGSALGDKGDIVLADLSQYLMIKKGGLKQDVSAHVRFINGEMTFRFTMRNNGQPMWEKPLTPYKGANTLSPYVTLAERA